MSLAVFEACPWLGDADSHSLAVVSRSSRSSKGAKGRWFACAPRSRIAYARRNRIACAPVFFKAVWSVVWRAEAKALKFCFAYGG